MMVGIVVLLSVMFWLKFRLFVLGVIFRVMWFFDRIVGEIVSLMLNGLYLMVVVFSVCGMGIGILLLVRKLVFWFDKVIRFGLVSMCVMLFDFIKFRLLKSFLLIDLISRLNVELIGMVDLVDNFEELNVYLVSDEGENVLKLKLLCVWLKEKFVFFSIVLLNFIICMLICIVFGMFIEVVLMMLLFLGFFLLLVMVVEWCVWVSV